MNLRKIPTEVDIFFCLHTLFRKLSLIKYHIIIILCYYILFSLTNTLTLYKKHKASGLKNLSCGISSIIIPNWSFFICNLFSILTKTDSRPNRKRP